MTITAKVQRVDTAKKVITLDSMDHYCTTTAVPVTETMSIPLSVPSTS